MARDVRAGGGRRGNALLAATRVSCGNELVGTVPWVGCPPCMSQGLFCRGGWRLGLLRHGDWHVARGDQTGEGTRQRTDETRAGQLTKEPAGVGRD
jgi:hypothetical protein